MNISKCFPEFWEPLQHIIKPKSSTAGAPICCHSATWGWRWASKVGGFVGPGPQVRDLTELRETVSDRLELEDTQLVSTGEALGVGKTHAWSQKAPR